jgi:hypothetical protein
LVFALTVAGSTGGAQSAATDPSPAAPAVKEVRLQVDHSALLAQQMADAAEDSAYFVREDGGKALREQHGVGVVESVDAPAVIVKLAWKDYEGSVYLIEISTRRPGEAPRIVESFEATCINNSALTKAVVEKLPAALEQLAKPEQEPAPDPVEGDPATEPSGETTEADDPVVDDEQRLPLGPKGKAGIGLLVGGSVGLVTGGIVFAQQRRFDEDDPTALDWRGRDFRPPGVGVMIAGGVVAATGAVLLIVDRVQARRAHRPAKPEARLVPIPTGLAVTGRF